MADQLGPVTIGAREIYDAVVMLTAAVGELRGDLARQRDAHAVQVAQLADHRAETDRRLSGLSERLRGLDRRQWLLALATVAIASGGGGVAGAVVSAAVGGG